uniref:Uncharacterized protein n=1 Tax=Anguilla anguilla TaxID=7936 RepID=A0A0E9VPZ9_ANGAN
MAVVCCLPFVFCKHGLILNPQKHEEKKQ